MLKLEQANELFEKEAVLFGEANRVPFYRVIELFGKGVAKSVLEAERYHLEQKHKSAYYNSYWSDGYSVDYLTYNGFLLAVTYANVQEIKKMQEEEAAPDGKAG